MSGTAGQSAIEAVAKHFASPWQPGDGPPDAYLTIDGRRIALDVAVIAREHPGRERVAQARLREDAVARRVVRDVERALRAHVPDGKTMILTLGAPIRVPKQLVGALTNALLAYLESGAEEAEERTTILGNRVRFRVSNDGPSWNAKLIGLVFSGDPQPGQLAGTMRSLHDEIAAKAETRMPEGFAGDRWLVLSDDRCTVDAKTYRRLCSYLSLPHDFRKILMAPGGGRVATLAET